MTLKFNVLQRSRNKFKIIQPVFLVLLGVYFLQTAQVCNKLGWLPCYNLSVPIGIANGQNDCLHWETPCHDHDRLGKPISIRFV